MKIIILIVSLLVALSICSPTHAASRSGNRLYFTEINLDKTAGERIEEVRVSVACGHIEAILDIPDDWNIEVIRAISAVEEFHASAGHGGSMLENIKKLNGIIRIKITEEKCFDVSASILTSGNKARQIELPRSKLKLRP